MYELCTLHVPLSHLTLPDLLFAPPSRNTMFTTTFYIRTSSPTPYCPSTLAQFHPCHLASPHLLLNLSLTTLLYAKFHHELPVETCFTRSLITPSLDDSPTHTSRLRILNPSAYWSFKFIASVHLIPTLTTCFIA
jgi:hypothetical protein